MVSKKLFKNLCSVLLAVCLTLSLTISSSSVGFAAPKAKVNAAPKKTIISVQKGTPSTSKTKVKVTPKKAITSVQKGKLTITITQVSGENLIVKGRTSIDTSKSTYIQYYIGKNYKGTETECIYCAGFNANKNGEFQLSLPTSKLKGDGDYTIVLEQNPASNSILTPEHWMAFTKDAQGTVTFGDITSMEEISNLAQTVGMEICSRSFKIGNSKYSNDKIAITDTKVSSDGIEITGKTSIDTSKSTYIQYYIGKEYKATISECTSCAGISADKDGTFKLNIPVTTLKGDGKYEVVLEQNPASNTILAPKDWIAFAKDATGNVTFGDITSMDEISNLALTVGMQTAKTEFDIGSPYVPDNQIQITSSSYKNGKVIVKGKTLIDTSKSTYIQYYVGKIYPNTLSNCILCDGIKADNQGNFELSIPYDNLKGYGRYSIVLEQNPNSNTILAPEHWKAFYKDASGNTVFGDISAMGEISNLALTVGMKTAETEVNVNK